LQHAAMILIQFTQDTLTGAGGGPYPHISPIGAYDTGTGRALVLDVDRDYYEPYRVDAALIVKAMAGPGFDPESFIALLGTAR